MAFSSVDCDLPSVSGYRRNAPWNRCGGNNDNLDHMATEPILVMNKEQATVDVRTMLFEQFSHQFDKPFLEIDREYLVEMIVKQMEHAYKLGVADAKKQ